MMHKDVHAEMYRLSKADSNLDPDLRISLAQAYNLKAVADYETGPGAEISPERARDATRSARHFVAYFEKLLRTPGSEMSKQGRIGSTGLGPWRSLEDRAGSPDPTVVSPAAKSENTQKHGFWEVRDAL